MLINYQVILFCAEPSQNLGINRCHREAAGETHQHKHSNVYTNENCCEVIWTGEECPQKAIFSCGFGRRRVLLHNNSALTTSRIPFRRWISESRAATKLGFIRDRIQCHRREFSILSM